MTTQNVEACLIGYQHFGRDDLKITEDMITDYQRLKDNPKIRHIRPPALTIVSNQANPPVDIHPSVPPEQLQSQNNGNGVLPSIIIYNKEDQQIDEERKSIIDDEDSEDESICGDMTVSDVKRLPNRDLVRAPTKPDVRKNTSNNCKDKKILLIVTYK